MKKIIIFSISLLFIAYFYGVNAMAAAFPLTEDDITGNVGDAVGVEVTVTLASDLGETWDIQDSVSFVDTLTKENVETFFSVKPLPTGLYVDDIEIVNPALYNDPNYDDYENTSLVIHIKGDVDPNFNVKGYENDLIQMNIDAQYLNNCNESLSLHPVYSTGVYKITCQKYTVTYDVQGHGLAPDAEKVQKGFTATKPTDPTADGYVFEGWYTENTCDNLYDFENTLITGDITLYAKWTQEVIPEPIPEPEPEPIIEPEDDDNDVSIVVYTEPEYTVPVTCVD